jgi:hypothetical protein
MNLPSPPVDEAERLRALVDLKLLDTAPEERFDRVVRLAKRMFDVPMVAVTLVGRERQFHKAEIGLDRAEVPIDMSFCRHAIRGAGPMVVNDATTDARFRSNPLVVEDPNIRFYAGQPLSAPGGQPVGALCILDTEPREVSAAELDLLRDLADWVEKEMAAAEQLDQAVQIQRSLLPRSAPEIPGYAVAGQCVPANDISGDFFDWFVVDGSLQVVLADVMGKGVPAALIGAGVRAMLRGALRFNGVEEALRRTSHGLAADLDETSTFVTIFSASLDPATHTLTYVDAGHGLAGVIGADGGFRHLGSDDLPLGTLADASWAAQEAHLGPGDTFIAVSDGFLDFFAHPRDGLAEVQRMVLEADDARDVVDRVVRFSMKHVPLDDVTVVVLRREAL